MPNETDSEICNKTAEINANFVKPILEPTVKNAFIDRLSMAAKNEYIPMMPIDYSFETLCAGL